MREIYYFGVVCLLAGIATSFLLSSSDPLSARWKAWGSWQCQESGHNACFMVRYRECSTGSQTFCGNDTIHSELKPCDLITCPVHWTDWGNWQSNTTGVLCVQLRYRQCSTGNVSHCGDKKNTWEMKPCNYQSGTESIVVSGWDNWSQWLCHLGLNSTCTMSRSRQCRAPLQDCKGTSSEVLPCTQQECPYHFGLKIDCSLFERSHSFCYEPSVCVLYPPHVCYSDSHVLLQCPITCGCCDPSSIEFTKYTTSMYESVSSLTANTTISTIRTEPSTSTFLVTTPMKMQSTENPMVPTGTSVHWGRWGKWRCKIGDEGKCEMFRTRNCSVEDLSKCGNLNESKELTQCKQEICGDMVHMSQCASYKSSVISCNDRELSCSHTNQSRIICSNEQFASMVCPKNCGCCDNEREGYVSWQSWSSWTCTKMESVFNTRCHRYRQRQCSTGDAADCEGFPLETVDCHESDCSGADSMRVNCSLYDISSTCKDHLACSLFSATPWKICTVASYAKTCPELCACCQSSTSEFPVTQRTTTTTKMHTTESLTSKFTIKLPTTIPLPTTTPTEMHLTTTTKLPMSSTVTSIEWGKWGNWRCKTEEYGKCVMFRTRNCTEERMLKCSTLPESRELTECKQEICGDLYNLTRCSQYNGSASRCPEEASFCLPLTFTSQACDFVDFAKLCPKSCGCCENEREGHIVWESWSHWTCKKMESDISKICRMYRERQCSKGDAGDCTGPTFETTDCDESQCTGETSMQVDCSLVDRSSTCKDTPGCYVFSRKPWDICNDSNYVRLCPHMCACCRTTPNIFGVCNFDNGTLCTWTQSTQNVAFNWTLLNGPTQTDETGPNQDHTLQTLQGKYLFIESSAPRKVGEEASIVSPELPSDQTLCLEFWYYMYGNGTGSLIVHALLNDTNSKREFELFKMDGDHGERWIKASVTIFSKQIPNNYKLVITGTVGTTYTGDIAIDDLELRDGACTAMALSSLQTSTSVSFTGATTTEMHTTSRELGLR